MSTAIVTVIEFRKVSYSVENVDTKEDAMEQYLYPGTVCCEHGWEESHIVGVELFEEKEQNND